MRNVAPIALDGVTPRDLSDERASTSELEALFAPHLRLVREPSKEVRPTAISL